MNRRTTTAIMLLLFIVLNAYAYQFAGPFDNPLGQKYRTQMESLSVPPNSLPTSCRLATEVKTAPIFPATTNPFVTDNAKLIEFISLIGFGSKQLQEVSAALSALYADRDGRHEVGIWGLQFATEKAAAVAYGKLKDRDVLKKDRLLVTVWRDDDAARSCQEAIRKHLTSNGFDQISIKP